MSRKNRKYKEFEVPKQEISNTTVHENFNIMPDDFDSISIYREMYYAEISSYDRIVSRANATLTILTILGTGEIFIISPLLPLNFSTINWTYFIHCCISMILFALCCMFYFIIIKPHNIYRVTIKESYEKINQIKKYYKSKNKNKDSTIYAINKNMTERYIDGATMVRNINAKKGHNYHNLITMLAFTFVIIVICFIEKMCFSIG